jgi:hypothetical protein
METNKKDYLFKIGPLLFFPKDTRNKPPAYQDSFEQFRNVIRLAVILLYGMISIGLLANLFRQDRIFEHFGSRDTSFYLIFFIPLTLSLIDMYFVWLEKKTGIPMKPISKYMIYGSWLISAVYYACFVFSRLT